MFHIREKCFADIKFLIPGFVTHEKGEKTGKKKNVSDYLIKRIVNPYYFLFPITAIAEPITAIATTAPIITLSSVPDIFEDAEKVML